MKVMLLNEIVKSLLLKPKHEIETFGDLIIFFNIHVTQKVEFSMIHIPLKWHHIDKCNKNCKKVDI
jgi:hypothetical protein